MFEWLKRLTRSRKPTGGAPATRLQSTPPAVTLRWLLGLSGRLSDGSNESIRFRENIESPRIRLLELQAWTAEALGGPPDEQHLYALQDIINSLGTRLGFQIEYGSYSTERSTWMPFDGLWRLSEDLYMAVEIFSEPLERIDFARLDRDLRALSRNPALGQATVVACFVLCQGASPGIWNEIRSSSLHDRIRLLPLGTLFELLRMDTEGVLSRRQIPVLLRPLNPLGVNDVLGFLEEFITAYQEPQIAAEPSAPVAPPEVGAAPEVPQVPPPPPAPPALEEILEHYAQGSQEQARQHLTQYLATHPEDPQAWETAGDWALTAGDEDAAIRAYRASLSREAGRTGPVVALASIYRSQGEHPTALKVLDGAGGLDAATPVLLERCRLLLEIQSYEEAEQVAQVAHAASGGAPALKLLGMARAGKGDHSGAVAALQMAADQAPGDPDVDELLRLSREELELGESSPESLAGFAP